MSKTFASQGDLKPKKITFKKLSPNCYAFTAEGDPNTGVVVGDDGVLVVDTQATPVMAREVIRRIRRVTSKPIKYVVLSHYHAVRVLGAAAYKAEQIIASQTTLELIRERGKQDMKSEIGRFPRLFRGAKSIPGLTWPTLAFKDELTLRMGKLEVKIIHAGPGHTAGDTIVWVPSQRVLFSGDLVEYEAGIYTGDAQLEEWPATLRRLRALKPKALVPGRGPALTTPAQCDKAIRYTQDFVTRAVRQRQARGGRRQDAQAGLRPDPAPHGSEVRRLPDLRALHPVRRYARLRRGERHQAPAHLDRAARPGDVEDDRLGRKVRSRPALACGAGRTPPRKEEGGGFRGGRSR